MAGPVSLELDPLFLKALGYLHSKNKDSAEKLKALLDESLARGGDSSYRSLQKVRSASYKDSLTLSVIIHSYGAYCSSFLLWSSLGLGNAKKFCVQTEPD